MMTLERWGAKPINSSYFDVRPFWDRLDMTGGPTSCWPWTRSVGSHGYGQVTDGVTMRLAHRVAWVLSTGTQIPVGLTIDHLCRNPPCCNPAHLRILENRENATDNGNSRKTHCKWGHEFTPENTRINAKGHRYCRTCMKITNDKRKRETP